MPAWNTVFQEKEVYGKAAKEFSAKRKKRNRAQHPHPTLEHEISVECRQDGNNN
jgi:hypothetical protein